MTLEKAIQILKGTPGPHFILEGKEAYQACQLAIEALTYYQDLHYKGIVIPSYHLPSETNKERPS